MAKTRTDEVARLRAENRELRQSLNAAARQIGMASGIVSDTKTEIQTYVTDDTTDAEAILDTWAGTFTRRGSKRR